MTGNTGERKRAAAEARARKQRLLPGQENRRVRHGLTAETIDAMAERQGGRCLVCLRPVARHEWAVDHDHALAARHPHPVSVGCPRCVRALLCSACNSMLGFARDSAETLERAAMYVRTARG